MSVPGHLPQSLKLLFLSGLLLTALNGRSTKAKTELILLLFPRVHMTGILFLSLPLLIKLLLFLTATLLPTIRLLASSPQFFSLKRICVAGLVPLRRSQGLERKEHGRQVSGQRQLWSGGIPKPRPMPKLALRPSIYLVIRGPGVVRPVQVGSAAEYFRLVPRFTEDSVSHSFPSVAEARVYCAAIGIDFPGDQ